MLDKIKELASNKGNVDKLLTKSSNVIDIFTKTVTDLKDLNSQADTHIGAKEEAKRKLEAELVTLNALKQKHDKVIEKISKILE